VGLTPPRGEGYPRRLPLSISIRSYLSIDKSRISLFLDLGVKA